MKEITKPQKPSIDWIEAHHEIVAGITRLLDDYEDNYFKNVYENRGTGGIWEVAEDLTDEFQKINEDRVWDGEFFDEIEMFIDQKSKIAYNENN